MAETIKIEVEVKLAEKHDLLIAPKLLRIGQPYYVLTEKTNILTGVFVIDAFTNSITMERLFIAKRIYIPVPEWDDTLRYNLLQTDLKKATNYGHNLFKDIKEPVRVQN